MKNESQDWLDTGAAVGRQQAFAVIANKCSAAQALALKQLKESACHTQLGLSWEDFCGRFAGVSSRQADRIIAQFEEFGEAYFRLSNLARISADNFRAIAPAVTGECLDIDGEMVPIVPENAARIRAFVRAQKKLRPPQPSPAAPTVAKIELDLRHLLLDVGHCVAAHLTQPQLDALQGVVGHAIRSWIEIGDRLDRLQRRS